MSDPDVVGLVGFDGWLSGWSLERCPETSFTLLDSGWLEDMIVLRSDHQS